MGGQGTVPKEQNTQQSPGFGRSSTMQPVHSEKNRQASVGIGSVLAVLQCGQVRVDSKITAPSSRRVTDEEQHEPG
jgi:hypothetical protein